RKGIAELAQASEHSRSASRQSALAVRRHCHAGRYRRGCPDASPSLSKASFGRASKPSALDDRGSRAAAVLEGDGRSHSAWAQGCLKVWRLNTRTWDTSTTGMTTTMQRDNSVRATLNYTADDGTVAEVYFYEPPPGTIVRPPGDDPHEMEIVDGWSRADSFSLDREGFALKEFYSAFDRFDDDQAV